jgi:Tn3 transposase DDE domain-containing protein
MLSNVSDLSEVLSSMANDGHPVTAELAAATSPYMRKNIRRFGKYDLDMEEMPAPLFPKPLPFKVPL